ncbi:MAG: LysM domain-containing protein [Planctomycetota bacterium]
MTPKLFLAILALAAGFTAACGPKPLPPVAPLEYSDYIDKPGTKPAGPPPVGTRFYEVRKGDTLYGIAVKFYGNGKYWENIRAVNPGITDTRSLPVGLQLVIPALDIAPWAGR